MTDTVVNNEVKGDHNNTVQVGVVNGGAVFHGDTSFYQVTRDDPPQRKYEVARNHLAGGSPRLAEELLAEVVRSDLLSTSVAYHFALATLSERSVNELTPVEYRQIQDALSIADRFPRDSWQDALHVIGGLMQAVIDQERRPEPDFEALDQVLGEFSRLPDEQREEITRHLDMIIGGAVQDQLDKVTAVAIAQARTSRGRSERAWKFFEPEPQEPRRVPAHVTPRSTAPGWLKAVPGVPALVGGFLLLGGADDVVPEDGFAGWTALLLLGVAAIVYCGARRAALRGRRRRLDHEIGSPGQVTGRDELISTGSADFRDAVHRLIRDEVRRRQPSGSKDRQEWHEAVRQASWALFLTIVRTYGTHLPDDEDEHRRAVKREVRAGTLKWLIRMHVRDWARRWEAGTLFDHSRPTARDVLWGGLVAVSGMVAVLGAYGMLAASGGTAAGVAIVLLVLAGAGALAAGGAQVLGTSFAVRLEEADRAAVLEEERAEYRRWRERLADRPTDAEMARWLDFDKAHLKTEAMRRARLTNRDVVAHVVLTEGLPNAKRARYIYGPPRYSSYLVLVFLLTDNGVREFRVDLGFEDGSVRNERRASFRYDALVLAQVTEVGIRFAGERRHIVVFKDDDIAAVTDPREGMVVSRALRLSLKNSHDINLVIENFEGLSDQEVEDRGNLEELALGSSGVTSALYILEAVAAEGPGWITEERRRRDRRLREWARTEGDPGVLEYRGPIRAIESTRIEPERDRLPDRDGDGDQPDREPDRDDS